MADSKRPHYRMKRCPDDARAEAWLNEVAVEGYRFVSMTTVSMTNHFTKEIESDVWIIVALPDEAVVAGLPQSALVAR